MTCLAVPIQVLGAAAPRPTAESQILDLHKGHFIKKFEFSLYTSCLLYAKNTKNNYVTFIGTIPRALDPAINETVNRKKLGKRLIKPDLSNAMTVKVG